MSYDLVFKNGTIVDVKAKTSYRADLAVSGGVIAEIGRLTEKEKWTAAEKVLCPGFIDAHVHIESSMASPAAFAEAVLPHGTTTVIADPHEMVNVRGNGSYEISSGCIRGSAGFRLCDAAVFHSFHTI